MLEIASQSLIYLRSGWRYSGCLRCMTKELVIYLIIVLAYSKIRVRILAYLSVGSVPNSRVLEKVCGIFSYTDNGTFVLVLVFRPYYLVFSLSRSTGELSWCAMVSLTICEKLVWLLLER